MNRKEFPATVPRVGEIYAFVVTDENAARRGKRRTQMQRQGWWFEVTGVQTVGPLP